MPEPTEAELKKLLEQQDTFDPEDVPADAPITKEEGK